MDTRHRLLIIASLVLISISFTACAGRDKGSAPLNSEVVAPILLFNGTGASPGDVAAVEAILNSNHLSYSTANSAELNQMPESQLRQYRLLIVPGGNFVDIGNSLTSDTTANVRNAVQNGVNYLGICAGGFLAGKFGGGYKTFDLTGGVQFRFYSAENQGIHKTAVPIAIDGAPTREHYWEDGPQFTGWGTVVGKYPDNTPAIVEGKSGSGWVILTGVHPEAPENWRSGMTFNTPAGEDNDYALTLIQAALDGKPLTHM
jgi:glutamine amidotransferase-like uncharacterized protein